MYLYEYVKRYQTLVKILNNTERRGIEQEVHFALKLLYFKHVFPSKLKNIVEIGPSIQSLSKNTNYIQFRQENLIAGWRNENWNLKRPATYYFGFFVRPFFT